MSGEKKENKETKGRLMSRKEFLKGAGMIAGGIGAMAFLNACSPVTSTVNSTATSTATATTTATTTATATTTTTATATTPTTTTTPTAPSKVITLNYSSSDAAVGLNADQLKWYVSQLEQRTNGMVKVNIYWSNSLDKEADFITDMNNGIVDMARISPQLHPAQLPLHNIIGSPYNSPDIYAYFAALREFDQTNSALNDELNKAGLVINYTYSTGIFEFYSAKQITSLADFKGLQVRAYGQPRIDVYKQLGANPVSMSIYDVYDAVSRGVIQAFDNTISLSDDLKQYEVVKQEILFNDGCSPASDCFSAKAWNKLPSDVQDIIIKLRPDAEDHLAQTLIENDNSIISSWKQKGVNVGSLSDADMSKFKSLCLAADTNDIPPLEKAGGLASGTGLAVWNTFQTLVNKYVQQVAQQGYPWAPK